MARSPYPTPLPDPALKITGEYWSRLEVETSTKIDIGTRRYIAYYCNLYMYQICSFHERRSLLLISRQILRSAKSAQEFCRIIKQASSLRSGDSHEDFTDDYLDRDANRTLEIFSKSYNFDIRSLLRRNTHTTDDKFETQQFPRVGLRLWHSVTNFDEMAIHANEIIDTLASVAQISVQDLDDGIRTHGDPFIDELTLRIVIACNRSGIETKYTHDSLNFVRSIFSQMIEKFFNHLDASVYASILGATDDEIGDDGSPRGNKVAFNRIKRATTNVNPAKLHDLDNIDIFGSSDLCVDDPLYKLFRLSLIRL